MGIMKMGVVALTNCTGEVAFTAVPEQDKNQLFIYPTCHGNTQEYVFQLQTGALPWCPQNLKQNHFLEKQYW